MSELLKCALCIVMASPKLLADSSSCVFDSLPTPFSLFGPPSHFLSPFPLFISQLIFHYLQQHENMHILVSIDPNGKPDIFSSMYFSLSLSLRSTFLRRMPLTKKRRVCRAKPRRTLARGRLVSSHPAWMEPLALQAQPWWPVCRACLDSVPLLCRSWKGL